MKEIILEVLGRFGCNDAGESCQINLQSKAAQEMIATALEKELNIYLQDFVEAIITPQKHSPRPHVE
tara:strand:+ start:247 stop:447 length:201 start_codon:yes stop_codon:yes gene_type:complete